MSVDLIGPLPRSHAGHQYALVVVDDFTRFVEIYPLRTASTHAIVSKMISYFCRYGFPRSIRSDNGPQFAGKLWNDVCRSLGVTPRKIVPYRPQGNPTERANRTVKQIIKAYAHDHKDWDVHLDALSFAMRTALNDVTGQAPAFLTLGRMPRSPFEVVSSSEGTQVCEDREAATAYAASITSRLQNALSFSWARAEAQRAKQEAAYNKGRRAHSFTVGDEVLRRTNVLSDASKGVAASLVPPFEGPFVLHQQLGKNTFTLRDPVSGALCRRNVDQLRTFSRPPAWVRSPPVSSVQDVPVLQDPPVPTHRYDLRRRK